MLRLKLVVTAILVLALAGVSAHAAAAKTYQVTGPVLSLTADTMVVRKGDDKWEITRDAATKITGDLAVGSQVTIQYRMTAATVEVKPAKPEGKPAAKPAKTKS
jgi:hypothetical protein